MLNDLHLVKVWGVTEAKYKIFIIVVVVFSRGALKNRKGWNVLVAISTADTKRHKKRDKQECNTQCQHVLWPIAVEILCRDDNCLFKNMFNINICHQ